jgi:tRNA (mo5U34)-methyltransferase
MVRGVGTATARRSRVVSSIVMSVDVFDLERRVEGIEWYHTIDLGDGVVTPGWFDTRLLPQQVGFPEDLSGKRCLDVATFDGFWAFTMERRGASEVVAIDVPDPAQWDWPANSAPNAVEQLGHRRPGAGFAIAAETTGSGVERREINVYDLEPADVGTFDFVYVGSLLLHLRDPVGALMKVRQVCTGSLLLVDAVQRPGLRGRKPSASLDGMGRPWWWKPNVQGLVRMVEAAGFVPHGPVRRIRIPAGSGQLAPSFSTQVVRNRAARDAALIARFGDPHCAVTALPV